MSGISLIVCTRDRSQDCARLLASVVAAMRPGLPPIEVLIVDDGSTDRTPELADALAADDPRVRVHHQENRGYGGALRAGFSNAAGGLICFSDGDLQFDLREMSRLLSRLEDPAAAAVNAVIGYRIKRRDPPHRIFIAKSYNAIVSAAFGLRVRDIDCAMKLFRREVFDGLPLDADSPFLSAELLIKLRASGRSVVEVGVPHHARTAGSPTGAKPQVILRAVRDFWRLRLHMWVSRAHGLRRGRPVLGGPPA